MATQERPLDIDAVGELIGQPEYADKRFWLTDGEMIELPGFALALSRLFPPPEVG